MKLSRKALVLAVAGVLASPAIASTMVSAQTIVNPGTVTSTIKVNGPIPSGVTGVNLTVYCQNLKTTLGNNDGVDQQSVFLPISGGTAIMNFPLIGSGTNSSGVTYPGTSCRYTATVVGTANLTAGTLGLTVGGVAGRTFGAFIPHYVSTDAIVTLTFPGITVKKVVTGDEPTAGYAYPMTIACNSARRYGLHRRADQH